MTEDKARKRSIRTRMAKTGESYTAARRHVVKSKEVPSRGQSVDLGKSDESIKRGSGKTWDEWFAILDSWGAKERTHTEIARYVHEEHDVSGWWAETVTVGYERGRGMRGVNEQASGFYVGVTKTLPVGVNKLFEEFVDTRKRNPVARARDAPHANLTAGQVGSVRFSRWGEPRSRLFRVQGQIEGERQRAARTPAR